MPQIIDNEAIDRGGQLVDVAVNRSALTSFLRYRFDCYAYDANLPQPDNIDQLIGNLTLSLGARPWLEVFESCLQTRFERKGVNSEARRDLLIDLKQAQQQILGTEQPLGAYLYDSDRPLLYLNLGQIDSMPLLRQVWEHEVGHLVTISFHPELAQVQSDELLRELGIVAGTPLSTAAVTTLLANTAVLTLKQKISRRDFLRGLIGFGAASLIWSLPITRLLASKKIYETDPREQAVESYLANNQILTKAEFDRIFQFTATEISC